MNQDELKTLFDQQADRYDTQWARTAPINACLYLLLDALFSGLPEDARILCVGAGTGAEIAHLAGRHGRWRFTVVEPSGGMLARCRERSERDGFVARCQFHEGYLDSLADSAPHDAATCFLVSQFILDPSERSAFFRQISRRLGTDGVLASTDLASDVDSAGYAQLLRAWVAMMSAADVPSEAIARMRKAYAEDVGVLASDRIASIIQAGGFRSAVPFFQAGLIHGWISTRDPRIDDRPIDDNLRPAAGAEARAVAPPRSGA